MHKLKLSHLGSHHQAVQYTLLLVLFFTITLLQGCATNQVNTTGGEAADLLPHPGATVELKKIAIQDQQQYDFDPVALFNEKLVETFKDEQLLWSGDKTAPRFIFDATIINYEPGNAFKRWILPGWGSTVLEVRGELRSPDNGAVAAVIENKRSIFAGGAYTIGAWKSIFGNVADDLALEIKNRIYGGGFVVSLTPYSELSSGSVKTTNPLELEIKNITDQRGDKLRIGERKAAFGVKMDDVYTNRRVNEYLTETLSDALRTMGHKVGHSSSDVKIEGELIKCWVETPATALYWDITAEIELKLIVKRTGQVSGVTRIYTSKQAERTYTWPTASLIEKTVGASVADLMSQIQADTLWNTLANDSMTKRLSN